MEYLRKFNEIRMVSEGNSGDSYLGRVYVVKENMTGKLFISKKINILGYDDEQIRKVQQEALMMQKFEHRCIVSYIDSFKEEDVFIIVMEYCLCGDLDKLIKYHKAKSAFFPEATVKEWIGQLASALSHIHSMKILHRDVKPSNVFITKDGKLKLGDFGISKVLDRTSGNAQSQIGTPFYMSPEVCLGKAYSSKTDIWSLGCVVYEICTFKPPFYGESLIALYLEIVNKDPPDVHSYSSDINTLIKMMLSKDPETRPSSKEILISLGITDTYSGHSPDSPLTPLYNYSAESIDFESFGESLQESYSSDFESISNSKVSQNYSSDFESLSDIKNTSRLSII